MAELAFRGVRKSYGDTAVIHGVDCAIADGEFIVIVGPSGCGKSTLLRMVAGLEAISEGEIAIGGRVVNELEPAERDIAMVFQNYALYPHMTVFDNMSYGLKIRRMPRDEIGQRVARAAEILELGALLDRKPRQLSGGQRQRVAMGRAIVREPAVFLFDEPLSNLDAKLRVQMRLEIRKLHQALGITSIYVTHDQVEAMTLGQRLIVMNSGVVEQIGSPLELYDRPDTLFVAEFIGSPSMNVFDARISERGDSAEIAGGGRLPLAAAQPAAAGRTVKAGIRPEKLSVAIDSAGLGELRVDLVEPLGADTLVHGRLGAGGEGADLTVRLPGGTRVDAGDILGIAARPEDVHLFDAATGRRL